MNEEPLKRLLVVHTGGIGDFILTCPALTQLAKDWRITLLGRKDRLELAVLAGIAEAAYDWESVDFDTLFSVPSEKICEFVKEFHRVVIWMKDADQVAFQLRELGVRDVQWFPGLPPPEWSQHASLYYAACLGINDVVPLTWEIAGEKTPGCVVIHPGSGSAKKNWPLSHFLELAAHLQSTGYNPVMVLGPAEEGFPEIRDICCYRPGSLVDLARFISGTTLYVGNDSGVSHLAAALKCPSIVIFGPTNPDIWGPRAPWVRVVQGSPWPNVSEVIAACEQMFQTQDPWSLVPSARISR